MTSGPPTGVGVTSGPPTGVGVTSGPPTGVLVMAHGTPATPGDIEAFYTSIRRGRPPTPELLADLVGRYRAIGGTSPLRRLTRAQVDGLAAALDAAAPGRFVVRYGSKHTAPSIEDAVVELADAGVTRAVGIVLTPHRSSAGTGQYLERAARAADAVVPPIELVPVAGWFRTPGFASILAERVHTGLASLPDDVRAECPVIFTAHSVPTRAAAECDPYRGEVEASAAAVARAAGLDGPTGTTGTAGAAGTATGAAGTAGEAGAGAGARAEAGAGAGARAEAGAGASRWRVAWQSAGRTDDEWLGPRLLDEIRSLAAEGSRAVLVCPVGFVTDHLEVLFDLDLEAAEVAASVGMCFARTASLNDDPRFLAVLAEAVLAASEDGHEP